MKVAFAGPSIFPSASVRDALPGIVWRGPARQGDIARVVHEGAAAIALVDGLYGTLAAVWHKEILFALSEGVRVIGGASLGALRAAECWRFGMEGIGTIFEDYRSGRRVDDGDVALLHAPEELDYAPMTETIVDMQATLHALNKQDLISAVEAHRINQAAVQIFFWDRTLEVVLDRAGFQAADLNLLIDFYEANNVRQKRIDALLVIERLMCCPDTLGDRDARWKPSVTRSFRRVAYQEVGRLEAPA